MYKAMFFVQSVFSAFFSRSAVVSPAGGVKNEVIRKAIHFLIALSPSMAALNRPFTIFFLLTGSLGFALMEYLRHAGVKIPVVFSVISMASRPRENGRFILGPITLGFGALLALILFPPAVAAIAIYALAFGDGFASLAGKFLGKTRPAFLFGKSIEGSVACFVAAFTAAYLVSGRFYVALVAASTATLVEALPLEHLDNVAVPVAVGIAVQFVFYPF